MDYITRSSRDKIISYIMHYQLSKGAINSYYTRKKKRNGLDIPYEKSRSTSLTNPFNGHHKDSNIT